MCVCGGGGLGDFFWLFFLFVFFISFGLHRIDEDWYKKASMTLNLRMLRYLANHWVGIIVMS